MAQPQLKTDIEARVLDIGDTMTGNLMIHKNSWPQFILKSDTANYFSVDEINNTGGYILSTRTSDTANGVNGTYLTIHPQSSNNLLTIGKNVDGTYTEYNILHSGNIDSSLIGKYVRNSGDTLSGGLTFTNREPFRFAYEGDSTYTIAVMYKGIDGITFETPRATNASDGTITPFRIHTRGGQNAPLECSHITSTGNLKVANQISFGSNSHVCDWGGGETQFKTIDRNNNGQRYIYLFDKTRNNDLKTSLGFCEYINGTYYTYPILNTLNYKDYTISKSQYKDILGYLNLIHQSDFTRYGYTNTFKHNGSTISLASDFLYDGNASIKIDTSSSTGGIKGTQSYPLEPNSTYTFSCMLYSNVNFTGGTTNPVHMWVGTQPDSGSHLEIIQAYNQNLIANSWVQCYVTFKTPTTNQIYYFTPFLYGLPSSAIVYATNFSLVKGDIVPNYSRICLGDAWYRGDTITNAVWN